MRGSSPAKKDPEVIEIAYRFARNFRSIRIEKGDSHRKVAELIGLALAPSTISNMEICKTHPSLDAIVMLSRYAGKSVQEMMFEDLSRRDASPDDSDPGRP